MKNVRIYIVLEPANGEWKRVWEDNFDWNGAIDSTKWEFEVGGHGWGKYFHFLIQCHFFRLSNAYIYITNLGNNEKQYYTSNRLENARCELFPGSSNGRLIVEARRVRVEKEILCIYIYIFRKTCTILNLLRLV
jgi:hypothetical protein